MALRVPAGLVANCRKTRGGAEWLEGLPETFDILCRRWSIMPGTPFHSEVGLVLPVSLADRTSAVLKLAMPHMEGRHEIEGMLLWNGDPTVRVLEADLDTAAMLLEFCDPGTTLRAEPEPDQDTVIAGLLRRLWRSPPSPHRFRHLSAMVRYWADETRADVARWPDAPLVHEGLRLFEELSRPAASDVLLATDLHAGNVLRAQRQRWLVIDPKPFVGDPAYDATQHLLNCPERMQSEPNQTIRGFSDLLGLDHERVRLWMFARAAAEPRENWDNNDSVALARRLSGDR